MLRMFCMRCACLLSSVTDGINSGGMLRIAGQSGYDMDAVVGAGDREAWGGLVRLATWHLPGGLVGPPARWAAITSNAELWVK